MKTFVTADIHFSHSNILKFCPETRPYTDADHMNEEIIKGWNADVGHGDLTYILGDVAFCNANKAVTYLNRLNGRKILISGNHDVKLLKDNKFRECFNEIHVYHEMTWKGHMVCMFHYPIFKAWNRAHYGSVHLHGHLHGGVSGLEDYRARDVGIDAIGSMVVSMDDIVADALTGIIPAHH